MRSLFALPMASAIPLVMSGGVALAANAVAIEPANIHANRTETSTVIGTIRAAAPVQATGCRNGWCAAGGGYVRASKLRFTRGGQAASKARREYESYDYNVPLALPPYGFRRPSGAMAAGATTTNTAITPNSASSPESGRGVGAVRPRRLRIGAASMSEATRRGLERYGLSLRQS